MSRCARLFAFGLLLAVCGCDLDEPLSDPKKAKIDERLLGRWVGVSTKQNPDMEGSLLFVGRHSVEGNPAGLLEALTVDYDDKQQKIVGADSTEVAYCSVTKIGKTDMLNVLYESEPPSSAAFETRTGAAELSGKNSYDRWTKNPKRSVILFRYVVEGDLLKLSILNETKVSALIESGKLKRSAGLLAADRLAAYIEKSGADDLFVGDDETIVYKKAK